MQTISYTALRQNLSSIFNKISKNRETYHITRKGHESMDLIAESDFNAIQETLYLLSNPNNSKKLNLMVNNIFSGIERFCLFRDL